MRDDGLVREVLRLDRSRVAVDAALPCALAFAIPLVIGLATDHVADGVTASIGALIVGFANLGGGYRVRALTLLSTTLAAGLAALVGGATGASDAATVLLMGAWGFAGGLLVALGPRPAFAGMLSTWALLLSADLHVHGVGAVHVAALMTVGGLLQTAVAVAAWPLRPLGPERRAVRTAYRALAVCARSPSSAGLARCAAALAAAAELIGDAPSRTGTRERQRELVEQGEWIRLEIAALSDVRPADPQAVDRLLADAADALDGLAAGRPVADIAALRARAAAVSAPAVQQPALMLVTRISQGGRDPGVTLPGSPRGGALSRSLVALRAQLTPRSGAFRHATRLGVALMVAVIAYRALPLQRGYWVPLTVLFVLKPDYLATYSRGLARAAGTMLGVIVAAAIVTLAHPSDPVVLGLMTVLALAAYALFPANIALFSVTLTILIALLVDFSGASAIGAIEDRLIDTAIGSVIALGAFALWPTREEETLRQRIADVVAIHGRWLSAIVGGLADPAAYDPDAMHRDRLAARLALTNAQASLQRAAAEPVARRPDVGRAGAILAAIVRIDDSALVLAETAHDHRSRGVHPAIADWGQALRTSLDDFAAELGDPAAVAAPDPPEPSTLALVDAARARPDDVVLSITATRATSILAAIGGLRLRQTP